MKGPDSSYSHKEICDDIDDLEEEEICEDIEIPLHIKAVCELHS